MNSHSVLHYAGGLILILIGAMNVMMFRGMLPGSDSAVVQLWREELGKMDFVMGLLLIVLGVLRLFDAI